MISPMLSGPVILNNTPLVALWLLNRLDLLQSIYTTVCIPQAVLDEFLAVHHRQRQQSLVHSPWIQVASLHSAEYALAFPGLDQGEAEVLALAVERAARLVIMDERKDRKFAQRMGIPITGTLGVLLTAKSKGLIDNVASSIAVLLENGFYLQPALVDRTLSAAGEPIERDGTVE